MIEPRTYTTYVSGPAAGPGLGCGCHAAGAAGVAGLSGLPDQLVAALQQAFPGVTGPALMMGLAATPYVRDRQAFLAYYQAHRAEIDGLLAHVDVPRIVSSVTSPSDTGRRVVQVGAALAGAAAGLVAGWILFKK